MSLSKIHVPVSSKGQVTIPIEIRRKLGIYAGFRVAFELGANGDVILKTPRYHTIESLVGAAGSLPTPVDFKHMRDIAYRERYAGTKQGGE